MSERVCPKCLTSHACACPKPSAPTDRDECGIPHMLSKPPKDAGAKYGWQICDEVQRFVSNSSEMQFVPIAAYEKLERELADCRKAAVTLANHELKLTKRMANLEAGLREEQQKFQAETLRHSNLFQELTQARAELAEANNHITALEVKFIDSGLKSAALVEALERVESKCSIKSEVGTIAREALAKYGEGK